jgi:hypothetical protein
LKTIPGSGDRAVRGQKNPKAAKKRGKQRGIASKNACHLGLNLVRASSFPTSARREGPIENLSGGVTKFAVFDLQAAIHLLGVVGTEEAGKVALHKHEEDDHV